MPDYFKRPIQSDRMSQSYGHHQLHGHETKAAARREWLLMAGVVALILWAVVA